MWIILFVICLSISSNMYKQKWLTAVEFMLASQLKQFYQKKPLKISSSIRIINELHSERYVPLLVYKLGKQYHITRVTLSLTDCDNNRTHSDLIKLIKYIYYFYLPDYRAITWIMKWFYSLLKTCFTYYNNRLSQCSP